MQARLQPLLAKPQFSTKTYSALQTFYRSTDFQARHGPAFFLVAASTGTLGDADARDMADSVAAAVGKSTVVLADECCDMLLLSCATDLSSPWDAAPKTPAEKPVHPVPATQSSLDPPGAVTEANAYAFCPRCGLERAPGFRYCGRCGQDLSGADTSQPSPTAAEPVYETIEVVDHDTNMQRGWTSGDIRHFLLMRHAWPGGVEDFPVTEWFVPQYRTPEEVTERAGVQNVIRKLTNDLVSNGWEPIPKSSPWYSASFRRLIPPGSSAGSFGDDEAAAAMKEILSRGRAPKGYWG